MAKTGKNLIFGVLLFLISAMAEGKVNVEAYVDRNEVSVGDPVNFTVAIVADESVDAQEPRIRSIDNFELVNQWQSSATSQKLVQGSSGVNFETQRRKEFTYQLVPQKEGVLTIEPIEVVANGKVFKTPPIPVSVAAASARRSKPKGKAAPAWPDEEDSEDIFGQMLQQRQQMLQQMQQIQKQMGGQLDSIYDEEENSGLPPSTERPAFKSVPKNHDEAFYIGVEVDKTEVFEGQQVTVSWYLYTRGAMETLDRLKFPSLKGFWKEALEEAPSIQFYQEVVDNVPYKKALLATHALFPIKAGESVVDEYKIKSKVRMPSQVFGTFGPAYEYTKSSVRVPIKVKPLPVEGRPADFTGAVGRFKVNAKADEKIVTNQPFTLHIRFEGEGNAKLIDLPALNLPEGLELYDTKSEAKFFKNGKSFKDFEVLIIPRKEGTHIIPAISVSFFDPYAKKYDTQKTEALSLAAAPGAATPANLADSETNEAKGISDKKPAVDRSLDARLSYGGIHWGPIVNSQYLGGLGSLILIFAFAALMWLESRGRLSENHLQATVSARTKQIEKLAGQSQYRTAATQVLGIYGLLLGVTTEDTSRATLPLSRAVEKLSPSLRQEIEKDLVANFDYFQTLGFAPEELLGSLLDGPKWKEQWKLAQELIKKMQKTQINLDKA